MRLLQNQKAIAAALALLMVVPVLSFLRSADAAELKQRSIRVATSVPNSVTDHTIGFDVATAGTLGSIEFKYCSNSPLPSDPCTAPAGLSLTAATIGAQNGETGFSVHANSTVNNIVLTRPPVAASAQPVSYRLSSVSNPSAPSTSFFVRIATYQTDDATGPKTDDGTVVFSTSGGLGARAYVPPYLKFCVAVSVAPDCSSANGYSLDMGEFSRFSTKSVTSQFAGSTNDVNGYVTSMLGTTMTSGNNIINPLASPTPSIPSVSQFGINLRSNTSPSVGQNPLGAGTAVPASDYNQPNLFTFKNGTLAASPTSTDYNTFTVSYIVNVDIAQPPGIYATTLTYLSVAQF